jgi:hypothetical protein
MTECCQCGRRYWPGKGKCPGRPHQIQGWKHTEAKSCNHTPCVNCTHYVDEKEEEYELAERK